MKRVILFLTAITFAFGSLMAQPQKGPKDKEGGHKMRAVEYAKQFELNAKDSAAFVTLFHDYNKSLHAIHEKYRLPRPEEGEQLTEEQIEKRTLDHFTMSRVILDTREAYYKKFREILKPSQVRKIFGDERNRRDRMKGPRPEGPRPDGPKPDGPRPQIRK